MENVKNVMDFNAQPLLVAYTRNVREDYSEFLGESVHFAVCDDHDSPAVPLYNAYGRLFAECGFSKENGIISKGVTDIEVAKIGGEFIITAREIVRTNHGGGKFSSCESGNFVRWRTCDFADFSAPEITRDRYSSEEKSKIEFYCSAYSEDGLDADKAVSIPIPREVARALIEKNITVKYASTELPAEVTVKSRAELDNVMALIKYTDGSTHRKRVAWSAENIDFTKPGRYKISGKIITRHFPFPVENHPWADPVITYFNKKYYFIATNDSNGDTSFEIREADSPEALFSENARRNVILSAENTVFKNTFWAPEFHIVGGKMRIFCALTEGAGFDPQCRVMTLKDGGDMLCPSDWSEPIRCVMPDGRYLNQDPLGDGKNGITLDMTCFGAGGRSYAVWSYRTWEGTDSGSMLMIAENDPDEPWRLRTFPRLLSRPIYGWENNRGTDNNEGPYALVTQKKVYLAYSGGDARGQMYVVGMMSASVGDDLCDVKNWEISGAPALASNFVEGQYGCGHNAFFEDEFGDFYITYHGVTSPESRAILPGIRRVHFGKDGKPILGMSNEEDLPEGKECVEMDVVVG